MFYFKESLTENASWVLSNHRDKKVISIPKFTVKELKNYHILGIDFLYQTYKKQFRGAILNEEDGMNMQIQVAAFLQAMFKYVEQKFLVLIIAPDRYITNWHYHLTVHGGLKVQIITPKTCPEDFDQEHGLAILLAFSNIKLSEYLVDYDYFSIVIDAFDEVASKLIIRKLHGRFNIGLTQRNFYVNPDQKLQWTMLNWSNPGYVGKLANFYEIDNDNFANFRDNYRHWWFRLTWNFCESFKKITNEEKQEYLKTISKWGASHNLNSAKVIKKKSGGKRNRLKTIDDSKATDTDEKNVKKCKSVQKNRETESKSNQVENDIEKLDPETVDSKRVTEISSQSSEGTIIYDMAEVENEQGLEYVQLPNMDENPILNSIIRNFEKSPDPIAPQHPAYTCSPPDKYNVQEPNCSKAFDDKDVLLSIIDNTAVVDSTLDEEMLLDIKKEELRSQIFSEEPCTSTNFPQEDHSEFFQSLIDSDVPIAIVKRKVAPEKSQHDEINTILKDTEVLLK